MSDLISREAVLDALDFLPGDWRNVVAYKVEKIPSAERKGKWIKGEKHYYKDDDHAFYYYEIRCSECGAIRKIGWTGANFCPNCGADMRGEEDEDR